MLQINKLLLSVFLLVFTGVSLATPAGVNWQWINPKPQGNEFKALATDAASGRIIAVGRHGTIATSTDSGSSWALPASGVTVELNGAVIAASQGIAYAVGAQNTILSASSSSLATWNIDQTSAVGSLSLNAIAWNGDSSDPLFVVVGGAGKVLTNDGSSTTWTVQTSQAAAGTLTSVSWSPVLGLFVAVSATGKVIRSPDGVNWLIQAYTASSGFTNITWDGVANQFVAVGTGGLIATSPAGINWTERTSGTTLFLNGVVRQGSDLVAVGRLPVLVSSDNGVNWSQASSGWYSAVAVLGSSVLAAGPSGKIHASTDSAVNWSVLQPSASVTDANAEDVVWNGSKFVVTGNFISFSLSSSDGVNWVKTSSSAPKKITWDGTNFVGTGGNRVFTSADGLSWSRVILTNSPTPGLFDIAWDGSQYIAIGSLGTIYTSSDSTTDTWLSRTVTPSITDNLNAINADGPVPVVVGNAGTVLISSDNGVNWAAPATLPAISSENLFDVIWTGTQFVAVGDDGTVITSSDGNSWAQKAVFTIYSLRAIHWDGTQYIAVSSNGKIFTSTDLTSWTEQASGTSTQLKAITGNGSRLVAVGWNGSILSSAASYTIGGTVTGLNGSLALQNNAGDDLTVTSNGSFAFLTELLVGESYAVTILTQPSGQTCSLTNATATVATTDVTNVAISCSDIPTYSIGGTVTGLNGSLVLQNNAGDDLTVTSSGSFVFVNELLDGVAYDVSILTQPSNQTCNLLNGQGMVSSADVTSVSIACSDNAASPGTTGGTAPASSGGGGGALNFYLIALLSCISVLRRRYMKKL